MKANQGAAGIDAESIEMNHHGKALGRRLHCWQVAFRKFAQGMHAAIGANPHLVQHMREVIADCRNGSFAGDDGIIVKTSKAADMRTGPPALDKRRMS